MIEHSLATFIKHTQVKLDLKLELLDFIYLYGLTHTDVHTLIAPASQLECGLQA